METETEITDSKFSADGMTRRKDGKVTRTLVLRSQGEGMKQQDGRGGADKDTVMNAPEGVL